MDSLPEAEFRARIIEHASELNDQFVCARIGVSAGAALGCCILRQCKF